jgi:NAD(P)-dependent dehydrogenase (short-subunit alcohol dehydrogenase family)
MGAEPEVLPISVAAPLAGLFLITEDETGVANLVAQALQQRGVKTVLLPPSVLANSEQLTAQVTGLAGQGLVSGIVHLLGLNSYPLPENFADWQAATQVQIKGLVQLLKLCAQDLQAVGKEGYAVVLGASNLGGEFGRNGQCQPGSLIAGGQNGLLKTLAAEWPTVVTKSLDFDQATPAVIAARILEELLLPGGRIEVGYPQNTRTIFRSLEIPLTDRSGEPSLKPTQDWVLLATGGGTGITAQMLADLAPLGLTLILTGRSRSVPLASPEPTPESDLTQGITEIGQLRTLMLNQVKSEGITPTPVLVEQRVKQLLKQRSLRQSLDHLRSLGAKVEYHTVDSREPSQVEALFNHIYGHYGRLDAVVHGAGIIEDKLLADKPLDSFARVFDTKVDSLFLLSRYLRPESLKLLVLFSSIAGRYGNRGQSDYATANEVMNRFAWYLDQQWPSVRVVAINWGPWDSEGMASEGVKRQLREQGIIPIPEIEGRQFFLNEIYYGRKGEAEVIAGEGPWESKEQEQARLRIVDLAPKLPPRTFPLLERELQLQPNGSLTLSHQFSLLNDPYLRDYSPQGLPTLSPAIALEWLAELAQAGWPEWKLAEVRDFQVLQPVILPDSTASLEVMFKAIASSHSNTESIEIVTEMVAVETQAILYRAAVSLRYYLEDLSLSDPEPLTGGANLTHSEIYSGSYDLPGQPWQSLQSISQLQNLGVNAETLSSSVTEFLPPMGPPQPTWLIDPQWLDAALQLARLWGKSQSQTVTHVARLGAVQVSPSVPRPTTLTLALRAKESGTDSVKYRFDVDFLDNFGQIYLHLSDLEMAP